MAGSKGFSVDPDKLKDVADRVHRLIEAVSGNHGVTGNRPDFESSAKAESLTSALQKFWAGDDVFANAYGEEHKGILETFAQMEAQLQNLEASCRNTAQQYHGQDTQSRHDVTSSGGTEI